VVLVSLGTVDAVVVVLEVVVVLGWVTWLMPPIGGLAVPAVVLLVLVAGSAVVVVVPGAVVDVEPGSVVVVVLGSRGSAIPAEAKAPTIRQPVMAATSAHERRRRGISAED
jgi:hypothetical protein